MVVKAVPARCQAIIWTGWLFFTSWNNLKWIWIIVQSSLFDWRIKMNFHLWYLVHYVDAHYHIRQVAYNRSLVYGKKDTLQVLTANIWIPSYNIEITGILCGINHRNKYLNQAEVMLLSDALDIIETKMSYWRNCHYRLVNIGTIFP